MTREEAIEVYNGLINTKIKEAFEFFATELAESEDEKIRNAIVDALLSHCNSINLLSLRGYQIEDVKAWLEKQKEQKLLPGFDDLTPDEKMNHPLYLEGFDVGREVGRVEAEQKQREVDLGDEIEKRVMKLRTVPTYDELVGFARHFYELGQKGRGQQVRRIEYNRQRATGVISFEYRIIGRNTIENLDMNELEKAGIGWGDEVIVQIMKKEESK